MKAYPTYKESGVEWIGNIPKHWDILRLVNVGVFSASGIDKLSVEGQETVRMANYTDVYGNASHELWGTYDFMVTTAPKTKVEEHNLMEGDILFTPSSETIEDIGVSAVVMKNLPDVVYSYHLIRLRPFKNLDLRFRKYFCNYPGVYHQFSSVCKGTTRKILTRDNFREIRVAIPPLPEQQVIADFLDRKTAQIDTLIEKKQRQIDLLHEQRTALINHAVTKGLNPDVRMKDSGVEWLGEIPSHWEVKKIKHMAKIMRGQFSHRPRNDPAYYDGAFPFVQTGDVTSADKYITTYQQTLNELGYSVSKEFPKGTIVMTIAANIGDIAILGFKACFPDSMVGVVPFNTVSANYMYYNMKALKQEFIKTSTINTQMNINVDKIENQFSVQPPIQEQEEIANYLDDMLRKMVISSEKISNQIRLLQEYRTALISEAVTGKIDVRTAV